MSAARRRLLRDFKKLQEDPPLGCSGAPLENNLLSWNCIIFGPQGTPFEDGTFRLGVDFTEDYPNKAPKVRFVSKMFHPNVYADGSICLDILNTRWSPSYDVASILTSIQSLLDMPNPNSPANSLAAQLYQTDRREYDRRVVAIVEQSWLDADGCNDDEGEFVKKSVVDAQADDEQPTTTTAIVAVAVDGAADAANAGPPTNDNDSLVIFNPPAADDAVPVASTSANARSSAVASSSGASSAASSSAAAGQQRQ